MTRLTRIVTEHWAALEAGHVASALRTTTLPVVADSGALLAAVDSMGRRHLLIPVAIADDVIADRRSAAVQILPRRLTVDGAESAFADFVLLDGAFSEQFDLLVEQVLVGVELKPSRPFAVARSVLERWRGLFKAGPVLSESAIIGLFGELLVLEELVRQGVGGVALWTGPTGSAQDFHGQGWALEVKTTAAPEGRTFRVHGAAQLDPVGCELFLVWQRLEPAPDGRSLNEVVAGLLEQVDDEARMQMLLGLVGYRTADAPGYDTPRLQVADQGCFPVAENFPRIIRESFAHGALPAGVSDLHYTVDLDAVALVADDLDNLLLRLARAA